MYRLLAIRMATQQEYEDILLYKTAASNAGHKKYRDGLSTNDKRSIRDKVKFKDMLCSNNAYTCLRRTALACIE